MRNLIAALLIAIPVGTNTLHFDAPETTYKQIATQVAEEYKIEPALFHAIISVESQWNMNAYNARSKDIGLAQINERSARLHSFDLQRLKTDPWYNLRAGAYILADFKKRYGKREPNNWFVRYNLGARPIVGRRLNKALLYSNLVMKYYEGSKYVAYIE